MWYSFSNRILSKPEWKKADTNTHSDTLISFGYRYIRTYIVHRWWWLIHKMWCKISPVKFIGLISVSLKIILYIHDIGSVWRLEYGSNFGFPDKIKPCCSSDFLGSCCKHELLWESGECCWVSWGFKKN